MISVDEYVRLILMGLPAAAKDALDPQRMQTALAVDISKNYGETNRNPKYPRKPQGSTLQLVSGNLFKAATVYRAKGNKSRYVESGSTYTFILEIDLNVIPYARIHEYGGTINHPGGTPYFIGDDGLAKFVSKAKGGDLPVTKPHTITIPARPYIRPAFESFQTTTFPRIIDIMLRKLAEASS